MPPKGNGDERAQRAQFGVAVKLIFKQRIMHAGANKDERRQLLIGDARRAFERPGAFCIAPVDVGEKFPAIFVIFGVV